MKRGIFSALILGAFVFAVFFSSINYVGAQVPDINAGSTGICQEGGPDWCAVDCATGIRNGMEPSGQERCSPGTCGPGRELSKDKKKCVPIGSEDSEDRDTTPSSEGGGAQTPQETVETFENGLEDSCEISAGETCDYDSLGNTDKAKMNEWRYQFNDLKEQAPDIAASISDPVEAREFLDKIEELEERAGKEPPQVKAGRLLGPLGKRTGFGGYTAEEVSPNGYPRLDFLWGVGPKGAFKYDLVQDENGNWIAVATSGSGEEGFAIFEGFAAKPGEEDKLPSINPQTSFGAGGSEGFSAKANGEEDWGTVDFKRTTDPETGEVKLEPTIKVNEEAIEGPKEFEVEILQDGVPIDSIPMVIDILPTEAYEVEDPIRDLTSGFGGLSFGKIVLVLAVVLGVAVAASMAVRRSRSKK